MSRTATVVGAGPAGLMAAEVLVDAGFAVHVYEHMPSAGRKLLLAGRSGLNLTHAEPLDQLLGRYGAAPKVTAAVRAFTPDDLRAWAAELGASTFVGSTGRVFPTEMRATPLLRAWLARLTAAGVQLHTRQRWIGWAAASTAPTLVFRTPDGATAEVSSDVVVFALGGATWPRVGSDGGWADTFRTAGVDVRPLRASNCGLLVSWSPRFVDAHAGAPLKNVAVGVRDHWVRGDVTITAEGVESGPVYTQSAAVRDAIDATGTCTVHIDLLPDLPVADVVARLGRRRPKDSLTNTLRRTLGLSPVAVAFLREATGNELPVESEPLAALVKGVPLVITATAGIDRAISSAGGIALADVTDGFMLRSLPGQFVAGEMLDWDAPTGGYLLQASFSTAVAAARAATAWVDDRD
ncbi:MAG: TIGR03862 family flavoprotein [Actinomycetota bacterium]|nr:TIGR03862 family flavoprotein [Actinomycetota bacterium]